MNPGNVLELMGVLLTIIAILVLAYLATRYMSKLKFGGFKMTGGGSGHMKILDQLSVGQDMRILLVQAGTRYLLLSAAASGISLLKELSDEEAALWLCEPEEQTVASANNPSFRDSFLETLKQRRK